MKKLTYLLSTVALCSLLLVIGCKKDDDTGTPASDIVGAKLATQWEVSSVTFDSNPRTDSYGDFVLDITYDAAAQGGTYSKVGGPVNATPFPSQGTWEFTNPASLTATSTSFNITRGDGLLIAVSNLTETSMTLEFDFDESMHSGSRMMAVDGTWVFNLTVQ